LELALLSKQEGVAGTLVEHGANVNAVRVDSGTLIHWFISKRDLVSSLFLLKVQLPVPPPTFLFILARPCAHCDLFCCSVGVMCMSLIVATAPFFTWLPSRLV
jgi:hypothetical protein